MEIDWKHLGAPQTIGKILFFFPGEFKDSKLLIWKIMYWISS